MARLVSPARLISLAALAALIWLACLPKPPPAEGADRLAIDRIFTGQTVGGTQAPGFRLDVLEGGTGYPGSQVCSDTAGYLPHFWGSYIGGDRFTGTLASPWITVGRKIWYVPILGYPSSAGDNLSLYLESGGRQATIPYTGKNPGETLGWWEVDLSGWVGAKARVVCRDRLSGPQGWLGVGAPIETDEAGIPASRFTAATTDYARFFGAAAAIALLLVIPGIALRVREEWLPIPGVVLMAVTGAVLWLTHSGTSSAARRWVIIGYLTIAAAAWLRRQPAPFSLPAGSDAAAARRRQPVEPGSQSGERERLWIWAAGVLAAGALVYSIFPRPVAQEQNRGTSFQARMVASPPDHLIPYATAAYFQAGYRGKERSADYFGGSSVAARGPLVPWCVTTMLTVFRLQPEAPPQSTAEAWPATADGFYVARIVGVLTNACVVLGIVALAAALGGTPSTKFAMGWAALAPVVWINTAFVWPKLFAAYFVLLAAADLISDKNALRAGMLSALAYLAHPVGGLFCVPLLCLAWQRGRCRHAAVYCAGVMLPLLPWLAFKAWLHRPEDFWSYPLGDGHGLAHAASIGTWLQARLLNAWYTLIPGAFTFGKPVTEWLWGPLSGASRWALQSAKTLPGNLAWSGFLLALLAFRRWPSLSRDQRDFATYFLFPAFFVLLLYWGWSADGLGRNCLEPLSVALLAWTAAARRSSPWWLVLIGAESLATLLCGFAG